MFTKRFQSILEMNEWMIANKIISNLNHGLLSNIDMSNESLESFLAKMGLSEEIEAEWNLRIIVSHLQNNAVNTTLNHKKGFSNAVYYKHPQVLKLYWDSKVCDFEVPQFKFAWEGKVEPFKRLVNLKAQPDMVGNIKKFMTKQDCQKRTVIDYVISGGSEELLALLIKEFSEYINFKSLPFAVLRTRNTHLAPLFMNEFLLRCETNAALNEIVLEDYSFSLRLLEDARKYSVDPVEAMRQLIKAVSDIDRRKKWITTLSSVALLHGYADILSAAIDDLQVQGVAVQRAVNIIGMLHEADKVNYEVNTLKSAIFMFLPLFEKNPRILDLVFYGLIEEMNHEVKDNARILAELNKVLPETLRKATIDRFNIEVAKSIRTGMDISLQMFELSQERAPKESFIPLHEEFKTLIESGQAENDDYTYAMYLAFILGDHAFAKECYEASELCQKYDGSIDSVFVYLNRYIFVLFTELEIRFDFDLTEKFKNHLSNVVKSEPGEFSLLFDVMFFAKAFKKEKSLQTLYERILNIPFPGIDKGKIADDASYHYKFNTFVQTAFEILTMLMSLSSQEERILKAANWRNENNANLENLLLAADNVLSTKRLISELMLHIDSCKPPSMGEKIQLSATASINPAKYSREMMEDVIRLRSVIKAKEYEFKADQYAGELIEEEERLQAKQNARKQAKKAAKSARQERKQAEKEAARLEEIKQRQKEIIKQEEKCRLLQEDIKKLQEERKLLVKEHNKAQSSLASYYSERSLLKGQIKQFSIGRNRLFNQLAEVSEETAKLFIYNKVIQYGAPPSIALLFQQFEGRIYLVGGAVRDLELKIRAPRDFDLVLFATVSEVKVLYPDVEVKGEGEYSGVSIMIDGIKHDVALLKPEPDLSHEMILKRNSYKRDFTINAEYISFTRKGMVRIDPWNAASHKSQREIEFVNAEQAQDVFFHRPERLLRLIDICHYTQFTCSAIVNREIDNVKNDMPRFVEACKSHSDRMKRQYQKMLNQYGAYNLRNLLFANQMFAPLLYANILSIADFASLPLPMDFFPGFVNQQPSSSPIIPNINGFKK